jgi:hypothetical protein
VDDQRLLELCTQWQMARAQQEIIWAEQDFSRMDGSLPNEGIQPSTKPLAKMCELQDTLARVGEPQTVLGARELLGIAIKMLTYRIESPESTVAQGPVVQLIRNVNEALKWLDGDTLLHHDVGAGRSGRTGEAFRVSSAPMGEGGGLDGKVPQQNPELRTPHEAASAPAPRLFVKPEFNRPWSIQLRRKVDDLSFVFNLLATVTLIGLPLLAPRDNAGTHVREQPGDMMPVRDGSSVARTSPALVVTASQKKYVNEPLPLGMWLNNDSGKETVTIDGLLEGTELSLGTSRGLAGWVLTGGDLDKTFVGPPRDFVGVMNATVELSSAGGQLLESQVIQFEWIAKTEYVLRPVVEPAKPPAVVPSHPAPVVPSLNRT